MASIDDVSHDLARLLDALIRMKPDGMTPGMGQVGSFPGLVPQTYWAVQRGREAAANILTAVTQVNTLLNAVNEETLGRIEASTGTGEATLSRVEIAISQSVAQIESSLEQVLTFLPTVREDTSELRVAVESVSSDVQALSAKLDAIQQGNTNLNSKLDSLRADIQALPH